MRLAILIAASLLIALAAQASAAPGSSSPCDPDTAPFNECGSECNPDVPTYTLCNNVIVIGACVMLTVHGRSC